MLLSAVLGVLLAALTFGLQIPAGIILPTMAIGALYGRAMGMLVQAWQRNYPGAWFFTSCEPDVECITPGVFAIIGAASALGGVTRMTGILPFDRVERLLTLCGKSVDRGYYV